MGIIWGRNSCVSDIYMSTFEVPLERTTICVELFKASLGALQSVFPICGPNFFFKYITRRNRDQCLVWEPIF